MTTLYGYVSNTPNEYYGDIQESDLPKEEKVKLINQRAAEYNKQLQREALLGYGRIGLGSLLEGASMHPASNIPYVGTGIGGAAYGAGDAIMQGKPLGEILNEAGQGFLIGETVGAIPYAGKAIGKTKAGQAIGEFGGGVVNKIGQTPIGQKIGQGLGKIEDVLMTDIKAFNPNKQTMWHGSPYDFNKFSNEAIGTGEGVQAHGYGHYAALNKDVASDYADILSKAKAEENNSLFYKGKEYNFNDPTWGKNDPNYPFLAEINGLKKGKQVFNDVDDVVKRYTELYKNGLEKLNDPKEIEYLKSIGADVSPENLSKLTSEKKQALEFIKNFDKAKLEGLDVDKQLYKLSVPKDDVMLREDLPFSQQPKQVQEALKNIAKENPNYKLFNQYLNLNKTGKDLYEYLRSDLDYPNIWQDNILETMGNTPQKVSNILSQKGIKGISYNGGIDGEAAVIFNPDDIDIVRKFYNQPGAIEYLKKINPNIGSEAEAINKGLVDKKYYNRPQRKSLFDIIRGVE